MILALIAGLCMWAQDTLVALSELLLVRGHPWFGGTADGTSDLLALGSAGIGIVFAVRHGVTSTTLLIGLAILIGSILGAASGWHLSKHLPGGEP